MSWRTSSLVLMARNLGRTLGVNKYLSHLLNGKGYETNYDSAFQKILRPGDCVWDVGANVGYYTRQFAERVGSAGCVFAFEPSPLNYPRLSAECFGLDNVSIRQYGLGQSNGTLSFLQGADQLGATSRVVADGNGMVVDIRTAESLIEEKDVLLPNALKIDVEGFELEVIKGFGPHLAHPDLRLLGIEVHFGILKERGIPEAPRIIEQVLQSQGFTIAWPDASHILATRG